WDGTEIDQKQSYDFGTDTWATDLVVSKRSDGTEYYRLITHETNGRRIKEEFRFGGNRIVRRQDGFWEKFNDKGEALPEPVWAGDILIDENGIVVKRIYLTEPDVNSPNGLKIRTETDGNGRTVPMVKYVLYDLPNNEQEEQRADGSFILRNQHGVVSIQYPG